MKLYAIVIGKEPKYSPYVCYMVEYPQTFAVFETRSGAKQYAFKHQIKGARIIRFESAKSENKL